MFNTVMIAIGLLCIGEGVAYALFPDAVKRAMSLISAYPVEKLRVFGFVGMLVGAMLVWIFSH